MFIYIKLLLAPTTWERNTGVRKWMKIWGRPRGSVKSSEGGIRFTLLAFSLLTNHLSKERNPQGKERLCLKTKVFFSHFIVIIIVSKINSDHHYLRNNEGKPDVRWMKDVFYEVATRGMCWIVIFKRRATQWFNCYNLLCACCVCVFCPFCHSPPHYTR